MAFPTLTAPTLAVLLLLSHTLYRLCFLAFSRQNKTGAEELQKRLLLMQKEQKLIQEEAQQAVLQAAASQPAAMAGAHVGTPHGDSAAASGELLKVGTRVGRERGLLVVCCYKSNIIGLFKKKQGPLGSMVHAGLCHTAVPGA